MRWFALYKKLGKQTLKTLQKSSVIAIVNGEEVPMLLKFKHDGSPYLISKEEYNIKQCEGCAYYNIGDDYEDIEICKSKKCKYYND